MNSRFSGVKPILAALCFSRSISLALELMRVEVVDQALLQAEQVQQVLVLHRGVDLLLERVGDRVDDLQVLDEVEDRAVDHLQHQVLERRDLGELLALEQRHVLARAR